jgi:hypothetical protein
MAESRSTFQTGLYLAVLGVMLAALFTSEVLGRWLVPIALVAMVLASGWYFWPKLRGLRVRWPLYVLSPQPPRTVPIHRAPLLEAERRRQLKTLLISLARIGDDRATHPSHIQQRWIGGVNDLLQDAFGSDVVQAVLGFETFREKVAALRVVIKDFDNMEIRPDFDPRDHSGMAV